MHRAFDAATLHSSPRLAAETQLVDDGTGSVTVWRVHQSELVLVPAPYHGVFYAGDCYLVKYSYWAQGREQHILYYWLVSVTVLYLGVLYLYEVFIIFLRLTRRITF